MFKKDPLQIITFQTYGTDTHFYARGRALEDESINLEDKSFFKLLANSWKRFKADEIKHTALNVKLPNNQIFKVTSDSEGYFLMDITTENLSGMTNEEGWLPFEVSYDDVNVLRTIQNDNRFPGELLIPDPNSSFGVISDIDDTILHTGVVSTLKWRVLYNTFFKQASKRLALDGAAEFYHLLHRGSSGNESNPIFYVSHSPWNLYRYLKFFLKTNRFPKGPIVLRNFPKISLFRPKDEKPHKQKEIINILKAYPDLKFILIGDSGEHDPDIYMEIAKTYPDRILTIYLRSVKHEKKIIRVKGLIENYKTTPVLLVKHSRQAMEHAQENGFIAVP